MRSDTGRKGRAAVCKGDPGTGSSIVAIFPGRNTSRPDSLLTRNPHCMLSRGSSARRRPALIATPRRGPRKFLTTLEWLICFSDGTGTPPGSGQRREQKGVNNLSEVLAGCSFLLVHRLGRRCLFSLSHSPHSRPLPLLRPSCSPPPLSPSSPPPRLSSLPPRRSSPVRGSYRTATSLSVR